MSIQDEFTEDQWRLVRAAPALIAAGVMASDPGGLFSAVKEASAMGSSTRDALKAHADSPLLRAIIEARDDGLREEVQALVDGAESAMDKRDRIQEGSLERLESALELLREKATEEEVAAYEAWVTEMAQRVAEAGKEGGFLGFGGVAVTESEEKFLDRVRGVVG
jgi:hypothetical protein